MDGFWCPQCIVNGEERRRTGPWWAHKIQTLKDFVNPLITFNHKGYISLVCLFQADATNALGGDNV